MVFNEVERQVLLKYEKGQRIDSEDRYILEKLSSEGLVRFGLSVENDVYKGTAILSPAGHDLLRRDTIFKKPLRRWLYRLKAATF